MYAHLCWCLEPLGCAATCERCGKIVYEDDTVVSASTWETALALAEVACGRPTGSRRGRTPTALPLS